MRSSNETNKASMNTPSPLTPSDLGLSQFQFDNFHKLLAYAKAHPDIDFDMAAFLREPNGNAARLYTTVTQDHPCGTTCCLAGMGIFMGIPPLEKEVWVEYIGRIFTDNNLHWKYLFSEEHLNSLPHAIARLEDFLSNGLPQDVNLYTHEVL